MQIGAYAHLQPDTYDDGVRDKGEYFARYDDQQKLPEACDHGKLTRHDQPAHHQPDIDGNKVIQGRVGEDSDRVDLIEDLGQRIRFLSHLQHDDTEHHADDDDMYGIKLQHR